MSGDTAESKSGWSTPATDIGVWQGLDGINIGVTAGARSGPAVGDTVIRLYSDSFDGVNSRDQSDTLCSHRERLAMKRLATFDQHKSRLTEAKRIQDRETAVALRDHAFDYYDRRYLFDTQTDLSTLEREVGDVVTLEHAMVPGGSMRCEIVRQVVDAEQGLIRYRLREM